MPNYGVG
ncbi:hypothetical protein VTN00DRAFT_4564 [Thermoascus crustaceus]